MLKKMAAKALTGTSKIIFRGSSRFKSIRMSFKKKCAKIKGPIVVHNMAKVGSKTIVRSLKAYDPFAEIYQTHYLSEEGLIRAEERMGMLPSKFWAHIDENRKLSRRIRFAPEVKQWQVITLVRDPVERNISYFFHCLEYLLPSAADEFYTGRMTTTKLIELFRKNLHENSPLHFVFPPHIWFEAEMFPVFNIDVFAVPFPKDKGYMIYQGEKARLLLIRLESLQQCVAEAFYSFLDIPKFEIVNENTSALRLKNKKFPYYSLYAKFKEKIIFPRKYLDEMYGSKLVKHFYSDEEIAIFKQKWRST
jgi:hypothetical protein